MCFINFVVMNAFITVCQYHYALPIMAFSEISISKTDPLPTSESTMISQLWALHILLHKKAESKSFYIVYIACIDPIKFIKQNLRYSLGIPMPLSSILIAMPLFLFCSVS